MKEDKLMQLQDKIGYHFQNLSLLNNALTHSSYANERHWKYERNNERLEFLRASLVCEMSLASSAREIKLGEYLKLGHGEWVTGGGKRDSILSDAFEAVIGAIYLDGGLNPAREFILQYVLSDIEKKQLFCDSKTILQEIIQSKFHEKTNLSYALEKEEGPDHNKSFEVVCMVNEKAYGRGKGRTKKSAEQKAAYETILLLRQEK